MPAQLAHKEKIYPAHLVKTHYRANLSFTHGDGPYLYGTDGRRYLDFINGIAVNTLGHRHPSLVTAPPFEEP